MNSHYPLLRAALFLATMILMAPTQAAAAERTFQAININTIDNPRGYWEFLPSEYYENPTKEFPVVIFLHGLGEGGNGTTDLHKVLRNGPPDILNTPGHSLYNLFENEGVIVLSPQVTNNTWWNESHIRPFLDFVKSHYRIDSKRIYLTGLSAGASGTHQFMNDDPLAHEVAAFVVCAVRGVVNMDQGDYLSTRAAYWTLTSRGDFFVQALRSADRLAGNFLGTAPTTVNTTYPDATINRTASFYPTTGWQWETGVPMNLDSHIKATIFTGGSHNSWDRTYNNQNMWTWMFTQQKPDVTITQPSSNTLFNAGSSISLSAIATNRDATVISGANIAWSSNLAGSIGTGASLTTNSLSIGVHEITCAVTDPVYHQYIEKKVTITVVSTATFTSQYDFGAASMETPGWNNVTDRRAGVIENGIDTTGNPTGIRVAITDDFDGIQTAGVAVSDVYPVTVQQDIMFVSNSTPNAELLVGGLNPSQTFGFTFFASRAAGGNRTTNYTINGTTVSLNASRNTNQTVSLNDITPNAAGQVTVQIACDAAASHGYLGSMVITTTGAPNPRQVWLDTHFTAAELLDPAISGDLADPDGDGLANLIEYAFNLNPRQIENGPQFATISPDLSGNRLTLIFRRYPNKSDLTYEIKVSDDLIQWTTIARSTTGGMTVDVNGGSQSIQENGTDTIEVQVTDAADLSASSRRFYQIEVSR